MYEVLGILNIVLVVTITAPYWLKILNKYTLKTNADWYKQLLGFLRKAHKILGFVLLINIAIHGYLALGKFSINSGSITGFLFLITALLGIAFKFIKKPKIFKAHKLFALLAICMIALHLLLPDILNRFV